MALKDAARRWTERQLAEIEAMIEDLFNDEIAEATEEWFEFFAKFQEESERYQKAIRKAEQRGDEAEVKRLVKEYRTFVERHTLYNAEYTNIAQQTAWNMANIEALAIQIVNLYLPKIYAENYNILGTQLDEIPVPPGDMPVTGLTFPQGHVTLGYNFENVNPWTVENLLKYNVNLPKSAQWDMKLLNRIVLEGIKNGESMDKIAARIMKAFNVVQASAIRAARTAVTYAENKGRLDSYFWAEEKGIVLHKVWHSTQDKRTRKSHRNKPEGVGNEEVPIREKFSNGLMCPGDPNGEPKEVYNCRCAMGAKVIGFKRTDGSIVKVGAAPWEKPGQ